jgi:hypothetical protein
MFNPRIRNAGDLTSSELSRMGSGRSELKLRMRSNSIVSTSKHDDLFANDLLIEPLREFDNSNSNSSSARLNNPNSDKKEMPPLPPPGKEKQRKQRNTNTG